MSVSAVPGLIGPASTSRVPHAPSWPYVAFGVQRSGKTSTMAVPTLLSWTGAAIATSTKEELVRLTGRHRAA